MSVIDSASFATPEAGEEDLRDLLLEVLPGDGSTMGNQSAREAVLWENADKLRAQMDAAECKYLVVGLIFLGA